MGMEMRMLEWIQSSLRCDVLDVVMPFITGLGDGGMLWIVCALLLLAHPKTRKAGMAVAVSLVMEMVCYNMILKPFVARIRPCDVNQAVQMLIPRPNDFSFPSGHTGASFAAASALFFDGSRLSVPAFLMAALIGFSRLYLYVHYPSDILAGACIGIMLGWLGNVLVTAAERKWYRRFHVSA